jgi:PAS domain S-box-containing protein
VLLVQSFFGQGRWFEIHGRPLGDRFLVHFHDITERLRAEAARRQSEQRFQGLVNGVSDHAIYLLDPKGDIATWNAAAERMSGYPAAELVGKPLSFLFPPELVERGEPRRRLEETVRHGRFKTEARLFRRDGSAFIAESTYTCLFDELGAPSGFAIVTRDVTKEREIEASLRTSEERLRLAVESGAVGIWEEILGEGRLVANPQCLAIWGLPLDRQPTYDEFFALVHPDDREYFDQKRREVLNAEVGFEFEWEYRVIGQAKERPRWVECHGRVVGQPNPPGGRRVIGVLRDRTSRHELDEFRELSAGMIAHDLRSPLSAIQLSSHLLIEREGLAEGGVKKVRTILRKVDGMAQMVEQLLRYTQVRFGGGIPLEKSFTDLEEVCRIVISDVQSASPGCEIHFRAEGDCHGLWDRIGLTEVVGNLAGNAIRHGEPGEPIFVLARDEGDQVVFQVRNLGPPIPQDLIPVIFEPFRRPRESPARGSIGLGLFIVREMVNAHGGTIDLSSSAAAGTTFTVRLPRGAAAHPSHA